jgi:membrane-bound serine protease (ClpP class)
MAPNTSIGAAHPVSMGPGGAEKTDDVMKQKLENYAGSYIEAIAQKRGRNVEWARSSVTTSESITAEKALELKVIDIVSPDLKDLLRQLDQRQVRGTSLNLAAATISHIPMLPRERLFQMLWRPEVMLILMLAAVYGLIGELSNPGAILPGVVGAIALILALNMMAILPINMAGVALILLAVILFGIDIFAPTHGVLTFGGIVSFFLGALMLFERGSGLRISLAFLIPITLLTALFFLFVAGAGLRAQRLPVRSGPETMLGQIVPALSRIDPSGGRVFIEGEHWNATSETPIEQGTTVLVEGFNGLTLKVRPATPAKI